MKKMLALLAIATAVSTLMVFGAIRFTYPYMLASEEARKSIEVSVSQMKELRSAELSSDMIAFGIFSALLCGVLASCLGVSKNVSGRFGSLVIGLVLGAIAGAGMGWIGHWLELNPAFEISDPTVYTVVRWCIMLLPVAIAAGIATSISTKSFNQIAHSVIGALLGAVGAAMIYAVVAGTFTTIESRSKVLPFHDANRILIISASTFCIGIGIFLQLHRKNNDPQGLNV